MHRREVNSTVETAGKVIDFYIHGELLVLEIEHLVVVVIGHEVHTRPDVLLLALSDELEGEGGAGSGNSIGGLVVGSVQSAVLGAGGGGTTQSCVPGVSGVAVSEAGRRVQPAPVCIEHDRRLHVRATTAGGASL